MLRTLCALLAVLAVLAAPAPALAKGETVKIEIKGRGLARPLEITAPEVVRSFSIWNGPGTTASGQPVHLDPSKQAGLFIDWPKGKAQQRPDGLPTFEVTFQLRLGTSNSRSYAVLYQFDAATPGGFIYLPGRDDEKYASNVSLIARGVEGNWFYSSAAWERLVRPLIEEALRARPPTEGDVVAVAVNDADAVAAAAMSIR